jgi:hypothetical protein
MNYYSVIGKVRFEYVISFAAFFIWIKILILIKYIKSFGVIFAIIQKSMIEVSKFLILWCLEILIFGSVASLLLG